MSLENRVGVGTGLSEEMVKAFAEHKASKLTVAVKDGESPTQVLVEATKLAQEFPNVGCMLAQSEKGSQVVFYLK